ncbi:uncharacterized protein K452DRAFT_327762 [Aplosporella prunicola CBS 121167]|uniref:Cytochrome P450 n=1 Tax=Aplosporella prunicola CBS 121167 TaxID=1176127 RepID=A0A6A6B6L6_9PEZI|nr:uncharacterized protein K452DRAFT_327762 [Aplosporella prunicola CBS 121167]KAF2139782.1 hypothetical protein K452DRAFT_327762 [Aplosporella prunicola CBS 121167]
MAFSTFVIPAFLLWYCSKCIYNLYIHPLRSYPGPLLCRASSIPRIWHRLVGTNLYHAHQAHQKYGPVVRLSPTELSNITSGTWDDAYSNLNGYTALPKEPAFIMPVAGLPRGVVQTIDGLEHVRQRRAFAPAFTTAALRKQETMILTHMRKLIDRLQRACKHGNGETVENMADLFNFMSFDVMSELVFGKPLGLLDAGVYSPWADNVFAVFRASSIHGIVCYYAPLLRRLMMRVLASKRMVGKRDEHLSYSADLVNQRLEQGENTGLPDIWTLVGKKRDALTRGEVHINACIFMTAGTETTATALCGVVWYLATHQEQLNTLTREVRSMSVEEEPFTMQTLARLPYLNAVINESLRLYPPTPDMLYRIVPKGGTVICGKQVPTGTAVGIHQWPAYHSALNFHRPDEFIPERWLQTAEGEFANDDRKIFHPFSRGPRNCIGKDLALHEIRLALAQVLSHFNLLTVVGSEDWIRQKSHIVWVKPPLMVRMKAV